MSRDDATSTSVLRRAIARDPEAWERLVSLYSPLVTHWCRQAGIPDADVPDVSQEVLVAVSVSLPKYQADRQGTTFRAWVRGIARHKLQDYAQRRIEPAAGGSQARRQLEQVPAPADDLELSESPAELDGVYRRALSQVRCEFEERTWEAFWRVVAEERSPAEIAAEMGISAAAVRQAKSRVLRRLKEELGELIA
jgi:RNA polymerase sigma-70 factor (ECF subfamily)